MQLHVLDLSSPDVLEQRAATLHVLRGLGVPDAVLRHSTVEVWNKADALTAGHMRALPALLEGRPGGHRRAVMARPAVESVEGWWQGQGQGGQWKDRHSRKRKRGRTEWGTHEYHEAAEGDDDDDDAAEDDDDGDAVEGDDDGEDNVTGRMGGGGGVGDGEGRREEAGRRAAAGAAPGLAAWPVGAGALGGSGSGVSTVNTGGASGGESGGPAAAQSDRQQGHRTRPFLFGSARPAHDDDADGPPPRRSGSSSSTRQPDAGVLESWRYRPSRVPNTGTGEGQASDGAGDGGAAPVAPDNDSDGARSHPHHPQWGQRWQHGGGPQHGHRRCHSRAELGGDPSGPAAAESGADGSEDGLARAQGGGSSGASQQLHQHTSGTTTAWRQPGSEVGGRGTQASLLGGSTSEQDGQATTMAGAQGDHGVGWDGDGDDDDDEEDWNAPLGPEDEAAYARAVIELAHRDCPDPPATVVVSARTGQGLGELLAQVRAVLQQQGRLPAGGQSGWAHV